MPDRRAGVGFLASAALPGAGQYYLGSERWVPYIAVETWAWLSYADRKREGRRLERRYREVARSVARRVGTGGRDSVFTYYEAMAEFEASGAFDRDPAADGVQPEEDTVTFNGKQWERARALYLPGGVARPPGSPEYQNALAYYLNNAIPPAYAWSWGDNNLEQQVFIRLIGESDQALRSSTGMLGLILANHLLSSIDALVTARLQAAANGKRELRIGSELQPLNGALRWTTTIRFTTGN